MDIPFTADEIAELRLIVNNYNLIGETNESIETYIRRVINHSIITPARMERTKREQEGLQRKILTLPPEGLAELEVLLNKYSSDSKRVR